MILGVPKQFNGTVGTTAVRVNFGGPSIHVSVKNTSTNVLYASFDEGVTFLSIVGKENSYYDEMCVPGVWLKGSGAGTTYEVLATI